MFVHGHSSSVSAGESTLQEYESLRKAWVARNRMFFRTLDVIAGVVVVVSVVVWRLLPWGGWYAGLVAGMVLSFDISVRMNPPAWIQQWGAGGVGEQRTGRALDALSPRWSVIHDWQLAGRGNVDHVVVGPGGVFALETKNIGTPVRVDGDTLTASRLDGRRRYATAAPSRQARGNAAAMSRELNKAGVRCWVRAVVVVWGEFGQRVVEGDRVTTVHGDHLFEWLNSQRPWPDQWRITAAQHHLSRPSREPTEVAG